MLAKAMTTAHPEIQVWVQLQAYSHANSTSNECLFARRSKLLPLAWLRTACSSLRQLTGFVRCYTEREFTLKGTKFERP